MTEIDDAITAHEGNLHGLTEAKKTLIIATSLAEHNASLPHGTEEDYRTDVDWSISEHEGRKHGSEPVPPTDPDPDPEPSSSWFLPDGTQKSSPSFEGFGAGVVGGRNGQVIEVTNLDLAGPGSLTYAIYANEPRTLVFPYGGGNYPLALGNIPSNLTIAGQTAGGGGVTIVIDGEWAPRPADNLIMRHVRLRGTGNVPNSDVFNLLESSNIVLDHCVFSYGTDEVLSMTLRTYNITIQWSMIYHPLNGFGSLWIEGSRNVSAHHNLWAHCGSRTPKFSGQVAQLNGEHAYCDLVNNVIYNYKAISMSNAGSGESNAVGNVWIPGPNTPNPPTHREMTLWQNESGGYRRTLYAHDNVGPNNPWGDGYQLNSWEAEMVGGSSGSVKILSGSRSDTRLPMPLVKTDRPMDALERVLNLAGLVAGPVRDSLDAAIIDDVRNKTGEYIAAAPTLPTLPRGTYPIDTNHDGIPDNWVPNAEGEAAITAGVSELEVYLDSIA